MNKLLCCNSDGTWKLIEKMMNDGNVLNVLPGSLSQYAECDFILDLSTNKVIKDRYGIGNNERNKGEEVYFLVDKDSLGYYGDSDGSSKESIIEILEDTPQEDFKDLVIIKGSVINPEVKRSFKIE